MNLKAFRGEGVKISTTTDAPQGAGTPSVAWPALPMKWRVSETRGKANPLMLQDE